MSAQAEARLVRYSPVELIDAVRDGRIRYPNPPRPSAADTARVVDGLRRGFPVRPLLLWQDPAEPVLWVLDGGDVVAALLVASGVTPTGPDDEPLRFDADTGEVLSWGQRPAEDHEILDLPALVGAPDPEEFLAAERVAGVHADRARSLLAALRRPLIAAQVTDLPRSDLPALFRRNPVRRGVHIGDLGPTIGPDPGADAADWPWSSRAADLVLFAGSMAGPDLPDEDVWRLLLVAEGRDSEAPYDPAAPMSDLPREGLDAVRAVGDSQRILRGWFWLAGGDLLPDVALLAVVARFRRVFPAIEDPVIPLLRRWVWRAALGDAEIDLSPAALEVIRDDATDSALRLLARTPLPTPAPPGRELLDLASRRGRLVLQGMASLHPRDLTTGELIDIEHSRVQPILDDRPAEPANLMFHDHVYAAGLHSVLDAVLGAGDPVLLASHGIDATGVDLLRVRDDDAFLARRAALLDRVVPEVWRRRTEPGAAARRPVALLFEDDHGG